ncbi:hypothetical protein [Methylobacterium gnaphalii]|uniref:Uncharacterized protein n=1 Tax=Methylobacterium gnaphalii TaxID=1010610 RepID=A0A512JG15_9HYPH|nr:hypothetical protein [Methylobacterium gnaphalii]GEP08895.1 hypothetical protein MGN01_07400 [Methylobacterium gnaphalii]GJD70661.1 hypothetical protein MMMDOFMJ_3613 [Methylobacterium gnaphalii]GLS47660.1 hypothetical protein GCM10007885_05040 [Methylobacterium gnaphalii]
MTEDTLEELLLRSAQATDFEFRSFSMEAQAKRIARAFQYSKVVVALYPTHDETGFAHMLLKGTPARLELEVQEAARLMGPFRMLRPTWFALTVTSPDVARAIRDVHEMKRHERATKAKESKLTSEFREELTPLGLKRFSQTNVVARYTHYVRSKGLTLRKIRISMERA